MTLNFATTLLIDSRPPVHGVVPYETEKERFSALRFFLGGDPLEISSQTPGADALSSTIEAEASWSFEKASLCFGICLDPGFGSLGLTMLCIAASGLSNRLRFRERGF